MANFNLRSWMESNGWTQAKLGKRLELSRWTIKRMMDKGAPAHIELACRELSRENS